MGYDTTPHPSQYPHIPQLPAEPCGKIRINNKIYTIQKILFVTKGLVGCGTVCYLVSLDKQEYIIKDHWVQGDQDKVMNEIKMLEAMHGVPGVPKLVDYWMVERSDGKIDRTKEYRHPDVADAVSILGTYCTHVCLIMESCARPLTEFRTLREFVKALRDIVIIQCTAVLECNVLHRNCSLYNAMIVDELDDSKWLLIDWEFTVFISENDEYSIGGTGTIPFMSRRLLAQVADLQVQATKQQSRKSSSNTPALPISHVSQSYADDLKSLCYVFIYICIKYSSPHVSSKEARIVNQFHPYFADLIPLAKEWCTLLKDNMEIQVTFDSVLDMLEHHLATLPEDLSVFSSTKENLKKFAVGLDNLVKHSKHIAEWESSIRTESPISMQSANLKQKRAEAEDKSG
ncbi:kinase-like domain-containing protein [Suillus variegatus]|nr:kinase-like domain-containing protein [Suillus variegatus]